MSKERFVQEMFEDCKLYFPWITERALSYRRYGPKAPELFLFLDDGAVVMYDYLEKYILNVVKSDGTVSESYWRIMFSRRLQKAMDLAGFGQRELADAIDASQSVISKYLNGKSIPNLYVAERMAEVLECDVNYFLDFPKF